MLVADLGAIDLPAFLRGCMLSRFLQKFSAVLISTILAVFLAVTIAPLQSQEAKQDSLIAVPLFRHIDPTRKDPDFKAYQVIRFAVSDDFPPFSYRTSNGALTGFNVAIANSLCRILRVECLFMVKPFNQANDAVKDQQADAIITGLAETAQTTTVLSFTRPYFRFSARFAVRKISAINSSNVGALAGKRLGVIAGSEHEVFLKENFRRSTVRAFDNRQDAFDGLRTGAVDALFGDSLQLMFWITGRKSKDCCRFAGDAYVDVATFSQPMAIGVGPDNRKLRELLDYALDRLQTSGRYSKIFRQYFPLSPWGDGEAKPENAT